MGYAPPGVLIRKLPENRRHRLARLRTGALMLIAAIAVSGVVLQETRGRHAGDQVASAPAAFNYFPG